jgi:hypothetical protein
MKWAAIILGLIFVAIAVMYWVVPAGSLPPYFPGFEAGSVRIHVKHGIASLAAGIVLFAIAWFAGRR